MAWIWGSIPPEWPQADLPVSRRCNEVQAAVDSVVWHWPAVHPGLCIQEVLTFTVNVVYDWLPATNTKKMTPRNKKLEEVVCVNQKFKEDTKYSKCGNSLIPSWKRNYQALRPYQLLLSTASPKPGVSTMVRVSWTPPSLISTLDCSTWKSAKVMLLTP